MIPKTTGRDRLILLGIVAVVLFGAPLGAAEATNQTTDPWPQITITLPGEVEMVLVRVPAGTFRLGSPLGEQGRHENEGPRHQVTLSRDFYVGKYEVTQEQWASLMGSWPFVSSDLGSGGDYPIYNLSWADVMGADGFVARLDEHLKATGQPGVGMFRLPTEAEWEYAARADTSSRFHFGDNLACDDHCGACSPSDQYLWWCANNTPAGAKKVGQKLPNLWDLYDMHGNVGEWVLDRYQVYPSQSQTDPTGPPGPTIGEQRVVRGGSWDDSGRDARSACRYGADPLARASTVGFRLVNVCAAHRVLPVGYVADDAIDVTISVAPLVNPVTAETWGRSYAIEETVPEGWSVSDLSAGGEYQGSRRTIRWGLFHSNDARTLTYRLRPTETPAGPYAFSGIISVHGTSEAICGDHHLEAWSLFHPADLDADWRLEIDEVTAYAAAWLEGARWEISPRPIPTNYVTTAGQLWQDGEGYHYDDGETPSWAIGRRAGAGAEPRRTVRPQVAGKSGTAVAAVMPSSYVAGRGLTVSVTVSPQSGAQVYAVYDLPPAGWTVSRITASGTFDAVNGMVKWGPFSDHQSRTLSYVATPPAGEAGVRHFAGQASFDGRSNAITGRRSIAPQGGACVDTATALCLNNGRFRVEVDWREFRGETGDGMAVDQRSDDSGLFWFFDSQNWEMLVKVLKGCALNGHYWVFSAATTNVEYTLRVTDTQTNEVKTYFNPLGTAAPAITDTSAFASCP